MDNKNIKEITINFRRQTFNPIDVIAILSRDLDVKCKKTRRILEAMNILDALINDYAEQSRQESITRARRLMSTIKNITANDSLSDSISVELANKMEEKLEEYNLSPKESIKSKIIEDKNHNKIADEAFEALKALWKKQYPDMK